MDDELRNMNQSLDEAQQKLEEPHKKIEIDQDPENTSQEITNENGLIDEKDEFNIDPENKSIVQETEPIETESTKNSEKSNHSNLIENDNKSHNSAITNEDSNELKDDNINEEENDPSTELQEKAGDKLKEGEELSLIHI